MKTTDKQIAANRRNAAKSTGPVTPAGKAIAARNSLKHGLLAREVVIDGGEGAESQEEFDALLQGLRGQLAPVGPLEEMLVEKIAAAYWRLRRAPRYEVGQIRKKLDTVTNDYNHEPWDEPTADEIRRVEETLWAWQNDKEQFTRMHESRRDIEEIFHSKNWHQLYEKLAKTVAGVSNDSPASIRGSLNRAGWTDDAIWQAHIDLCTEKIQEWTKELEKVEKKVQKKYRLGLQARKKTACMPEEQDLNRLLKYEGSLDRQFYRAIDQLQRLQERRAGECVPGPAKTDPAVPPESIN